MDAYEFCSPYPTVSFSTIWDLNIVVDFLMAEAGLVPVALQLAGGYFDRTALP